MTVSALLELERRFDACRLPCPPWCDGTCETVGHTGTAIIHTQAPVEVPCTADRLDDPIGKVTVQASRFDELDGSPSGLIELNVAAAGTILGDYANFTAAQARQLIAALTAAVECIDPAGGQ